MLAGERLTDPRAAAGCGAGRVEGLERQTPVGLRGARPDARRGLGGSGHEPSESGKGLLGFRAEGARLPKAGVGQGPAGRGRGRRCVLSLRTGRAGQNDAWEVLTDQRGPVPEVPHRIVPPHPRPGDAGGSGAGLGSKASSGAEGAPRGPRGWARGGACGAGRLWTPWPCSPTGAFCIPLYVPYVLTGRWPFSRGLCKLWLVVDYLLCASSVFNIVLISYDRFLSVTRAVSPCGCRSHSWGEVARSGPRRPWQGMAASELWVVPGECVPC